MNAPHAVTRIVLSDWAARHVKFRSSRVSLTSTCDFACTMVQVDTLLQVILSEANIHPTATSTAGEDPRILPHVLAPAHDAGVDQTAKLATVMATLETQQAEIEKQRAEIEAGKLENKKLRETVRAHNLLCDSRCTSRSDSAGMVRRASPVPHLVPLVHHATRQACDLTTTAGLCSCNLRLLGSPFFCCDFSSKCVPVTQMEKRLPKPHAGPDGSVDAGERSCRCSSTIHHQKLIILRRVEAESLLLPSPCGICATLSC